MRIRTVLAAMLSTAAALALAQGYPVPSFDCANTTTAQELRICRSPELSELDGRHAALVERAVRAAPDRDKAIAEMDAWLERVRNPCQTDRCLVDAYSAHIAEIERTVPAPKPMPAFTMPALPLPAGNAGGPESVKVAPRVSPAPAPASNDDDEEDDGGDTRDYFIAAAIALLALVIAAAMRAGKRKQPRA